MSFLSAVFWGLLVLSVLVFIHEGGHYLAARAFGVRVTEFMLGLPCRWNLSFKSRRVGTRIGVTPLLLGGYNRICGMEPVGDAPLADVLACVQEHGRISIEDLAAELGIDDDDALNALVTLSDWASIEPYYDPELGEKPEQKTWPKSFQTLARDANMLTEFDRGHDFSLEGSTRAGEPRAITGDPEQLLNNERSHTYLGKGFLKRFAMLVAGPLINVLFAFVVVVLAYSIVGMDVSSNEARIGSIEDGSLAQESGLQTDDLILSVADENMDPGSIVQVTDWSSMTDALHVYLSSGENFILNVRRGDEQIQVAVNQGEEPHDLLGINATTVRWRPDVLTSSRLAIRYGKFVADYVGQLLVPQKTMEVLNQSSSVVGISVMASEAASSGFLDLQLLAASISMSLGFMNLLPIPPLDGGKILIEVIQLLIRRPLSLKAQNAVSYVGLAFFLFIFIVVVKNDIFRFVIG